MESSLTDKQKEERNNAEEDVIRSTSVIMGKFKFFGELVYRLKTRFTWEVNTMATDGRYIFISPKFCATLTDKQITFVICHEIMHNVMGHFARMETRDHQLWNIACDLEINPLLVDEGLITKEELKNKMHGLYEDRFLGLSAEIIYDQLLEENKAMQELLKKLKEQFKDKNFGEVISPQQGQEISGDTGSGDEDGEDGDGEGEGKGKGNGEGEDGEDGEGSGDSEKGGQSGGADKANNKALKEGRNDDEEKRKWQEAANQAAQKVGSAIGKLLRAKVVNLTRSRIDWKKELKKYIGKALARTEFKMPARRHLYRGLFLHTGKRQYNSVDTIVIGIDTSGSISDKMVEKFLVETVNIISVKKPTTTYIIYFDDAVNFVDKVEHISSKAGAQNFEYGRIRGSGGNAYGFEKPFEWMEQNLVKKGRRVEVAIFFTDGYTGKRSCSPDNSTQKKPSFGDNVIWGIINDSANYIKMPTSWSKRVDIDTKIDLGID